MVSPLLTVREAERFLRIRNGSFFSRIGDRVPVHKDPVTGRIKIHIKNLEKYLHETSGFIKKDQH